MRSSSRSRSSRLGRILLLLHGCDRALRMLAVWHFFRRRPPHLPTPWPAVSLIQPISRGTSGLEHALRSRLVLDYPATVQQILICDAADSASLATCRAVLAEWPGVNAEIVVLPSTNGSIASKIAKLQAGLAQATGAVLCFVDDDVTLRGTTLQSFVGYLEEPRAGAVFGLACYTAWDTAWSSLMSLFVNTNALLSYVPLCYLAEPWTITGHCFAVKRGIFEAAGGLDQMDNRLDDDHELARRLRRLGLRAVQTPVIYDVRNELPTSNAYRAQMKRWFVFPRQAMAPTMSLYEQAVTLVGSAGNLLPPSLAILALLRHRRSDIRGLVASLGMFAVCYALCEALYLKRATPRRRWLLLPAVALLAPIEVLLALASDDEVEWRGQRLRVRRGGTFEVIG